LFEPTNGRVLRAGAIEQPIPKRLFDRSVSNALFPNHLLGSVFIVSIRRNGLQAINRLSATNFDLIEPDALRSPKYWFVNRPLFHRTLRTGLTALTEVVFS